MLGGGFGAGEELRPTVVPRRVEEMAVEDRGDGLRVQFSQPQHGWLEVKIDTQGEEFNEAVSYTPNDFLLELTSALSLILQGADGIAVASCEPAVYEFAFSPVTDPGLLHLQVTKYSNWKRRQRTGTAVLSTHGPTLDIVTPFWQALCELEAQVDPTAYREAMRRDFPSASLQRLSGLLAIQRPR
jgi:hypothetical protein